MLRLCLALGLLGLLAANLGCAMCASCHDCRYGAEGGVRPRLDACCGRVGSVFDPADGGEIGVPADALYEGQYHSAPIPEPTKAMPTADQRSVLRPQGTMYR